MRDRRLQSLRPSRNYALAFSAGLALMLAAACASAQDTPAGAAGGVAQTGTRAAAGNSSGTPRDAVPSAKRGPTPPPGASFQQTIPTPSPGPASCGDWDGPSAPFIAAAARQYGEAVWCVRVENAGDVAWVVVTDGDPGQVGAPIKGAAVGVDRCPATDGSCADGRNDHSRDHWSWYRLPGNQEDRYYGTLDNGVIKVIGTDAPDLFDPLGASPHFVVDPSFKPGS